MNVLKLSDASRPLAEYVQHLEGEPMVVQDESGQPLAVLLPVTREAMEDFEREVQALADNPRFWQLLDRARSDELVPAEEAWRELGVRP